MHTVISIGQISCCTNQLDELSVCLRKPSSIRRRKKSTNSVSLYIKSPWAKSCLLYMPYFLQTVRLLFFSNAVPLLNNFLRSLSQFILSPRQRGVRWRTTTKACLLSMSCPKKVAHRVILAKRQYIDASNMSYVCRR